MTPPFIARHAILLVLVAVGAASCRRPRNSSGVSDSTFVATMAELKRANDAATSESARVATRAQILQRRGLTPAMLEQAAQALARNPARAQAVWQAVERRAADTTRSRADSIRRR